jgi:hypothetical protein
MSDLAQPQPRRGGRPSKGPREALTARVHPALKQLVVADAEARGLDVTDHLAAILADHYARELEAEQDAA